jgi:hypothetical protein
MRRERGNSVVTAFPDAPGPSQTSGEGGICLSMLPGFRFLFAATFLSMSILVFGLGAAALLRAAHEQFASNPSWHAGPEASFAQQIEATRPVLAMLRVEPPAAAQKAPGNAGAINPPAIPTPDEQAATNAPAAPMPPVAARPDMSAPENPAPGQVAAAPNDTPTTDATKVAAPASLSETNVAPTAAEPIPQTANEVIPAAREIDALASSPASGPATPEADIALTTIATLDNPSVSVEPPPAKIVSAKPDPSELRKRLRARRAAHRRRMAARAARQALLLAQQQQSLNPFVQSFPQPQPAPIGAAARAR